MGLKTETNSFEEYTPIKSKPLVCFIGILLGALPGIGLWLLLSYLHFSAGIMGFVIVGGSLLVYRKMNHTSTKGASLFCIIFCLLIIITITSSIEAYSLRNEYNEIVNDKDSTTELRTDFINALRSNGQTDADIDVKLKSQFDIDGISDTEGINKLVKDMLDEQYISDHSFSTVPDSFIDSYRCLFDYLESDNDYTKKFFTNLIVGIAFAILAYALITNSTFMSSEDDI